LEKGSKTLFQKLPFGSKIAVSACLLGVNCRYDGGHNLIPAILKLKEHYVLIPVCPEQLGGLTTPRPPAEIMGSRVVTKTGLEVTEAFEKGALETLAILKTLEVQTAILKDVSPSCGSSRIYDGSFSRVQIPGGGVTAELLRKRGVAVYAEEKVSEWMIR
jgi:uncharacterized protein YbbK (DUF523 family)